MLTRDSVIMAYEIILQRKPESDAVCDSYVSNYKDLASVGQALINSEEFRLKFGARMCVPFQLFPGYSENERAIFRQFEGFVGTGSPGFVTDFLGRLTRPVFLAGLSRLDGAVEPVPWPAGNFHAETAEWLGVLKSVLSARSRWRILELGAGFGAWMVSSGLAARQKGILDIVLYGVEADEGHIEFMHQHLSDNGFNPSEHHIISGVVGPEDGEAMWATAHDPSAVYGGRAVIVDPADDASPALSGLRPVKVFGIKGLLAREPIWDLVHIDIQGDEGKICHAGIGEMTKKVKWVVVGTHGREMDGTVMKIFHEAGWSLENEKPSLLAGHQIRRALELMMSMDGVQVWRNPNLSERPL